LLKKIGTCEWIRAFDYRFRNARDWVYERSRFTLIVPITKPMKGSL